MSYVTRDTSDHLTIKSCSHDSKQAIPLTPSLFDRGPWAEKVNFLEENATQMSLEADYVIGEVELDAETVPWLL